MIASVAEIQRIILAPSSRLEVSMAHRLDLIDQRSVQKGNHKTTKIGVSFQSVLFSFSVHFSSEREEPAGEQATDDNTKMESICNIRLPRWFVQNQYDLMVKREKNGWLFCPTVFPTVEDDCAFFEACRRGDLDTMKTLLSTKKALRSDRSSIAGRNWSALMVTIKRRSVQACTLLIAAEMLSVVLQEMLVAYTLTSYTLKSAPVRYV